MILIVSAIALIISILAFMNTLKFLKNGIKISGRVKEIKRTGIDGIQSYYPVIEYYDEHDKRKCTIESNIASSFKNVEVGDKVELLYLSSRRYKKVLINNWPSKWGFPLTFLIFSIGFGLIYFISN